ncbi:hypothetical protein BCV72DRAFT_256786 [Rhizopus microsporus var. microsporus]|nr:hypothetical protein BCV72DRAFT_256786 [Rhizopus microsporus var. microsporus]
MTMTLPIVRQSTDQSKNLKVNKEAIEKYGKLTVTGKNVSEDNIVEGYIQFILQHDPYYFNSMEAVSTAERKISTVPKTNLYGISYTTWDLFRLIQKLQKGDIKNWSQLVAMLGLQNVAGRAQFAQRIKRWMHRYKIDCYFNYLLGNEYDFNDPESDKNKSILSFNFNTKRKVKEKPESNEGDELEGEMETDYLKEYEGDVDDDDHKPKPIILPPGGRKRLRINSDPERLIQVAKNFIKRRRCDDSDVDEKEMENDATDEIESEAESEIETTATINGEHQEGSVISKSSKDKDILDESEEPVQRDEDGEDELESSASSSGSPVMEEVFNNNRKASSCSNCHMLESEVELLKKEIANLKLYISVVEDNLSRQKKATEASQQYINQLLLEKLKLRGYYTKWKQKLAKDILNGPVIPEDE